ncbi:hypothetical protein [Arthrobacter pityocampae]|uniref:hypothetical protein n=1 Tax=Arthrobacter pityocampae TaxID=547334 RepID=UPI003736E2E5
MGLAFVEDRSPSGGRHLYVPLREAITAAEARQFVESLGMRAPSLDPSPHQNPTDGCIRVPGSAHKSGGHQTLITPLTEAYGILTRRNPMTALEALRTFLAPELHRLEQTRRRTQAVAAAATAALQTARQAATASDTHTTGADRVTGVAGAGQNSPLRVVARTGLYEATRYASDSEARMAVLNHFAACRWSLDQVRAGMDNQYPGLAALYGAKADRLLPIEWAKAQAFTSAHTPGPRSRPRPVFGTEATNPSPLTGNKTAHNFTTSHTSLTGGSPRPASQPTAQSNSSVLDQQSQLSASSIHALVNDLENVLYAVLDHRLKDQGRVGISLRFLIRAVLAYMRTNQTNLLDVGCRSFAVALGKDHVTIARLLPQLEAASAGILTRIERGRGRNADTYAIQLPDQFAQLARDLTWRRGKIHAIRPVFRVLGDVAALAYEGIERGHRSPTTAELTRSTGISRRALTDHLARMEALGMIGRHHGRWQIIATTNLHQLADRLGATEDREAQITRYRKERAAWHAWLDRHLLPHLEEHELHDPERDEYWLPPHEDEDEHQRSLWHAA